MPSIVDLTQDDHIRQLATKPLVQAGHALHQKTEIVFGAFKPSELIEAKVAVSGKTSYHTRFELQNGQLTWQCSCPSQGFCRHLVATALGIQQEGRGDIYKAAGIIIKNRAMLVERSVGKPAFIAPGGRIEPGETAKEALVRELDEEFAIKVSANDLKPFGSFSAAAANHPNQKVHMQVFMVTKWRGEITPTGEVAEIRWITSQLPADIEVGSIFGHEVVPRLHTQGLID